VKATDEPEKISSSAGDNDLLDALIGTQAEYAAVIGPIIKAVKQMREVAEVLPASRQSAGLDLLQAFGAAVVARALAGDLPGIRVVCDDFLGRFRRLAGN
jgi:hypothetical protein